MKSKVFISIDNLKLIIKHRRSAVIFEMDESQMSESSRISFKFQPEIFTNLLKYIETVSHKSWTNLKPKEADSFGSDYSEYYDRKLDNNGYLSSELLTT